MTDSLATPCGLYCGSCRYFLVQRCRGCGQEDAPGKEGYKGCPILLCCRQKNRLQFCSQCGEFPCERLKESKTQHPEWLDLQSRLPLK